MDWFSLILGAINLTEKLIEHGNQSGELTDAQRAVLAERHAALAAKYNEAPPPPPEV